MVLRGALAGRDHCAGLRIPYGNLGQAMAASPGTQALEYDVIRKAKAANLHLYFQRHRISWSCNSLAEIQIDECVVDAVAAADSLVYAAFSDGCRRLQISRRAGLAALGKIRATLHQRRWPRYRSHARRNHDLRRAELRAFL